MAPSVRRSKKTAQLIMTALHEIGQAKGCTMDKICNFILKKYAVPEKDFKKYVNKAINRGLAFGAIKKCGGGFAIGEAVDKIRENRRPRSRSKKDKHGKRRRRHH